jgi:hypothetical protein
LSGEDYDLVIFIAKSTLPIYGVTACQD